MPAAFPLRMPLRCTVCSLGFAILLSACPRTVAPPPSSGDGGPGEFTPLGDRDGDGLCDPREVELGTLPDRMDTDRDRLPDGVEFVAGFSPDETDDPPPGHVVWALGSAGTEANAIVQFDVRGRGEDFEAAFEAPAFVPGASGSARNYFVSLRAHGVFPPEAAARVEPEAGRVRGLVGRALLSFEVRFRIPPSSDSGCLRGLPFQVVLKRSDGTRWPTQRRLLVAGLGEASPWCRWEGGCL